MCQFFVESGFTVLKLDRQLRNRIGSNCIVSTVRQSFETTEKNAAKCYAGTIQLSSSIKLKVV